MTSWTDNNHSIIVCVVIWASLCLCFGKSDRPHVHVSVLKFLSVLMFSRSIWWTWSFWRLYFIWLFLSFDIKGFLNVILFIEQKELYSSPKGNKNDHSSTRQHDSIKIDKWSEFFMIFLLFLTHCFSHDFIPTEVSETGIKVNSFLSC